MRFFFDRFRKTLPPDDIRVHWEVQWTEEPQGWEARIRQRYLDGWGPEFIIFLKGPDFRPKDAIEAWEQLTFNR